MFRLLALAATTAARPENATAYFAAANALWPPASAAGRCLATQRREGWTTKPRGCVPRTVNGTGQLLLF